MSVYAFELKIFASIPLIYLDLTNLRQIKSQLLSFKKKQIEAYIKSG